MWSIFIFLRVIGGGEGEGKEEEEERGGEEVGAQTKKVDTIFFPPRLSFFSESRVLAANTFFSRLVAARAWINTRVRR